MGDFSDRELYDLIVPCEQAVKDLSAVETSSVPLATLFDTSREIWAMAREAEAKERDGLKRKVMQELQAKLSKLITFLYSKSLELKVSREL